ncbi:LysR family transcriptional regulator [Bacillus sp. AFS077874]|uniref:LysR family transcriptional regulator n=1 Tax=Bacillus sp. AFS077874 TaxID=2033513 RepID=UPI000BF8EAB9|nr:LysR family transcriptional regulator [Bacillus sp. AFS077874]PFM82565.1 LysR family transcriptional regulator [Bacillus sp. AFS077874]
MELREIEYFLAICDELHFTRAAEKLGISQPALSRQMRALEDKLGVRLFDRLGKKIAITEAGKILKEESDKIFSNIKFIYEQIGELQKVKRGKLIVGAMSGELSKLASEVFLELHRMHPYLQMKIIKLDNIEERIIQNEIDIALTHQPYEKKQLTNIPLYNEEFSLVVPIDHHLAKRDIVEFEKIKDIPFVISPNNHYCRKLIDDAATSKGFVIQPIIELTDVQSILKIVKAGVGATILPNSLLAFENPQSLKVIKLVNPVICKEIAIVHHKKKYIGTAARNFMDMLLSHVNKKNLYVGNTEYSFINS